MYAYEFLTYFNYELKQRSCSDDTSPMVVIRSLLWNALKKLINIIRSYYESLSPRMNRFIVF